MVAYGSKKYSKIAYRVCRIFTTDAATLLKTGKNLHQFKQLAKICRNSIPELLSQRIFHSTATVSAMKGKIFVSLFALPFFSVGVWMLWSVGSTLVSAWQMDGWVQTEARLTAGGYTTHSGDDSDTHRAFATYSYTIDGQQYSGNRVSLNSGADNIGSYQKDIGRNLQNAQMAGELIMIYVDPDNPTASVIDRGVRWGLLGFKSIFLFVFGGVGLGLLVAAWRAPKEKDQTLPEFQDSPWLLNDDWQTSTIKSSSKSSMYGAWIFAALWNLISAPLPFVLYDEVLHKENYLALVGLLFPLVGIGLLVWAVRRTLEWTRFGPAPVTLDPYPGSIGGHVGGTIDLKLPYDAGHQFAVTLTCIHSYVSGSGKNRSKKEKALWQENLVAHAAPGANGTRLTFRFDIPDGFKESDTEKDDSYHIWRLNLSAVLPGTDLDRDYDLPVYATATQSRFLSNVAVKKSQDMQQAADEQAVRAATNLESASGVKRMFFPMGRHVGSAIGGFVVGGIFAAAGWFLIVQEGHTIFGSIFGGVGALIAIACLYMMLNSLEVRQVNREIVTVRRLIGIPISRKRMHRDAFASFHKNSSLKTQSGSKHTIYYSIEALDRQGEKMVIGEGFKGENEADAAIRLIGIEFGLAEAANDSNGADNGLYGTDLLS